MDFFKEILQSPILNGLGFLLGIISLILGYIFYREGLRLKKPSWDIRSNNLFTDFSSAVSDLVILYKEQKVKNLTISRIIFWNDGKDTINRGDIASTNPLKIIANENVNLIDAKFLVTNNEPSQFSISLQPDKTSCILDFEYLDYKQGGIIQVIHTGTSSRAIRVEGTIKGAKVQRKDIQPIWGLPLPTPPAFDEFILKKLPPLIRRRVIKAISFLVISATFISLFFLVINWNASPESRQIWEGASVILGMCSLLALLLYSLVRNQPPSGLEIFDNERLS